MAIDLQYIDTAEETELPFTNGSFPLYSSHKILLLKEEDIVRDILQKKTNAYLLSYKSFINQFID